MDASLLRQAHRGRRGERTWHAPGAAQPIHLVPPHLTPAGWGASFHWPTVDQDGQPIKRGVDLSRHRQLARHAARQLIDLARNERAS